MDVVADPAASAQLHLADADLGDSRLPARLKAAAARFAAHPEKSFPQLFTWNQLRGFYRLCEQDTATLAAVPQPHWHLTRQAMRRLPLVLIVHDTPELDSTSHQALPGAGPRGDHHGQGFLQHNRLAFRPDGTRLLGLAYQPVVVRQPTPQKETRRGNKKRDRESPLWTCGLTAVGKPPAGSVWVDVADRGADEYEAMVASKAIGHEFLFRVGQDLLVFTTSAHDQEAYLMQQARSLPAAGYDEVEIPGRGGRPPRVAKVALAVTPVWIPPPQTTAQRKSRPVLAAWGIRIWEIDPPPGMVEPLEWVLLGSLEPTTLEQLRQRRDWYCCRWGVEVYHDREKKGWSEEDRRFETAERMATRLANLAVVAVRIDPLRLAVKSSPNAAAEEVATPEEIEVICQRGGGRKGSRTEREFVHGVAKLGGFLGRKGDGEPGVRSLWRGYQRLQDMVAGFRLHHQYPLNPSG